MSQLPPEELNRITDYLSGVMAPDERTATELWIADDPRRQEVAGALGRSRHVLQAMQTEHFSVDDLVLDVSKHIRRTDQRAPRSHATSKRSWKRWALNAGAATIAAFLVALLPKAWDRVATSRAEPISRQYVTRDAQRAQLQLPDGSVVTLAPNTTLRYASDQRGARNIDLQGQAHFSVKHDAERPFTVRAGPAHVRVLGTAFTVRHYSDDTRAQVAVDAGKVAVGERRQVTLVPGEMSDVTDSSITVMKSGAADASAWVQGRLVFRDAPVLDVLRSVGRWQGYEFRLADSALARQQVSVVILVDQPQETMQVLKELLNVTMTFDGRVVTLARRASGRTTPPSDHNHRHAFSTPTGVGK